MKITRIETFRVPPRWLFCRVETEEGLVGWGKPAVEGRADAVRAAVHEHAELLIGNNPLRIEDHGQVMTEGAFYRGGPILADAVAGLDQALRAVHGQALDVPVHTHLLPGVVAPSPVPLATGERLYSRWGFLPPCRPASPSHPPRSVARRRHLRTPPHRRADGSHAKW